MTVYWLEQSEADVPFTNDWLSPGEARKLETLRFPKRRTDWRLGRWTAKCALARYANCRRGLNEIEILSAASGAPQVAGSDPPAISLSHRGGLACCAISPDAIDLGCDLEAIEPRSPAFLSCYFTAEEEQSIGLAAPSEQPRLAALLWSAKESALKALGCGLRADTRSVAVKDPDRLLPSTPDPEIWNPLRVCHNGGDFTGWWRSAGGFVRTMVAFPEPAVPVLLRHVQPREATNYRSRHIRLISW